MKLTLAANFVGSFLEPLPPDSFLTTSNTQYLLGLLPNDAAPHARLIDAVGSRVTCSPPALLTDEDILVLAPSNRFYTALRNAGWVQDGVGNMNRTRSTLPYANATNFTSYRLGGTDLNIIATKKHTFYRRFVRATLLATRFNLLNKKDRIELFQAVLYPELS